MIWASLCCGGDGDRSALGAKGGEAWVVLGDGSDDDTDDDGRDGGSFPRADDEDGCLRTRPRQAARKSKSNGFHGP